MKKIVYPIIILFVLLLVANCPAPFNTIDMPSSGSMQLLPRDEVSYTSRSFSEDFTYKTLFPVQLDITVELYDQSAGDGSELELLSSDTANVKLKLVNESGKAVFESFLGNDAHLKTSVYLPAVSEDITLTLQADGFKTREVVIEDMVEYEQIVRTMSMGRSDSFVSAKGMELDSDGDGIPDSYDVEPFQVNIPADGKLTVAYEDLYGRADAGDADYNDFITAYSITETISSDGTQLENIYVEASGKEKLAGYDHIFGFRLNAFTGLADITGDYVDRLGNTRSFEMLDQESPVNIELFKSTSVAKNKTVNFTVTFQEKQNIDEDAGKMVVDRPPYNPYLYVKNTGNDVHLIGEESLDGTYNSFMDENHFPWALLLPIDWDPPAEGQRIEEPYPRFTRWRESSGELSRDWYLHNDPWEPEESNTLLFASDRDGDMEIYSLDLETDEITQLTDNTYEDIQPDVSPDGTKIVFVSNRSGSWAIHTMNSDGSGVSSAITALEGAFFGSPSWNNDGTKIVYASNVDIFTMNEDGTSIANLTDSVFVNEIEPVWSPDGSQIAFSSTADGDLEIYLMNADGSGSPIQLTSNSSIDRQPSWSPDGTKLAFSAARDGNYDIFVINADGTEEINITKSSSDEKQPSWSSQGIAYVKNNDVFTILPDSSGDTNRTNNSGIDQDPDW